MSAGRGRRRVVITDCDHGTIEPEQGVLEGHDVELVLAQCRTVDEVVEAGAGAEALIVQYAPVDERVFEALTDLKAVVRYGVGVDTVDVEAATRRGVWVVNVPDYGVDEVAEHALALALGLLRGLAPLGVEVRAGSWDFSSARPLHRLSTRTLGVVGCGRIGGALARKAAALGLRTLGYDPAGPCADVEAVPFETLLAESDVVSLHAPLTEETRHLIGRDELARMRRTAVLVNTARGGLVDGAALLAALDSGALAGAGLDVLEQEPPEGASAALVHHPRVLVTPHAAWYSEEAFLTLKTEVAREALRVLDGDRPRSPVNEPAGAASRG